MIAGELAGLTPPPPPPHSWASRPEADVAIWHIVLAARRPLDRARGARAPTRSARCTSSRAAAWRSTARAVGPRTGAVVRVGRRPRARQPGGHRGAAPAGQADREPVARYGPFVMNTRARDRAGLRRLPGDAVRRVALAHRGTGPHPRPRAGSPSAPTAAWRSPPWPDPAGRSLSSGVRVCAVRSSGTSKAPPRPHPGEGTARQMEDPAAPLSRRDVLEHLAAPRLRALGRAGEGGHRAGVAHLRPGRARPAPAARRGARRRHRRRRAAAGERDHRGARRPDRAGDAAGRAVVGGPRRPAHRRRGAAAAPRRRRVRRAGGRARSVPRARSHAHPARATTPCRRTSTSGGPRAAG